MTKNILIYLALTSCLIQCRSFAKDVFLKKARQVDFQVINDEGFVKSMEEYFAENSKRNYGAQTCPIIQRSLIRTGDSLGFYRISDQGFLILNTFGEYGDLLRSVSERYPRVSEYCDIILSSGDIPPQARAFIFESYYEFDFADEEVQKIALIHLLFVCGAGIE